jgi:hypothetical protein
VIIGVDPWIFNRNSDQIRWWPLTGEAVDMAAILRASGSPGDATRFYGWLAGMLGEVAAQRLPGILSHEQLRLTLRRLRGADAVGVRSRAYHALDDEDSDLWVKRPDGSIRYRKEERDKTLAALREEAAAFAAAVPAYSLRDFHELDPVARTYFESFVRYLLRRGIRVVFFLSPLHPDAYPGVAARHENRMLIETERYVHELGDVLAIPVVGTYDGRNSGCTETQFIDAHHPDQACVEIMFRAAGRDR